MPMYDYQCKECGRMVEKLFKLSEKPKEFEDKCPHCNNLSVFEAVMSPVSMSYNGFFHASKVPSDLKTRFDQIRKHYPDMQSSV